jgi:hypothetical protein
MRNLKRRITVASVLGVIAGVLAFTSVPGHGQSTGSGTSRGANQPGQAGFDASPLVTGASAQAGSVVVPASSRSQGGLFAHTNIVVLSANPNAAMTAGPTLEGDVAAQAGAAGPLATVMLAETPRSMGCLYVQSPKYVGCAPSFSDIGGPSKVGYGAIVIVDAFDNPNAALDLKTFDTKFGLPAPPSFTKIYANGNGACGVPPFNAGWALEASLDIEWAHVFAPKAAIVLVEACSNSYADLFYAEQVAFNHLVNNYTATGGQVTNSWQGGEYSTEINDDPLFSDHFYNGARGWKPPILALAASGDSGFINGQAGYPSANPWVLTAGGTSVLRDSVTHAFVGESCWGGAGGGVSTYETWSNNFTGGNMGPWAAYQYQIFGQGSRATPDLSFNADPASGAYVYSASNGGWFVVGGTSLASPALAGIINRAGNKLGTVFLNAITGNNGFFSTEEHDLIYSQLPTKKAYATNFRDVTTGSNGTNAVAGWDYCTGVGSPIGLLGK